MLGMEFDVELEIFVGRNLACFREIYLATVAHMPRSDLYSINLFLKSSIMSDVFR
jgi:hypothetical protein